MICGTPERQNEWIDIFLLKCIHIAENIERCSEQKHIHIIGTISERGMETRRQSLDCHQLSRGGLIIANFMIILIRYMQVLHRRDLPGGVPLFPRGLGAGGGPGPQIWGHPGPVISN